MSGGTDATRTPSPHRRRLAGLGVAVLALGLLFWARVIVIAKMPRHAIADPVPAETASSDNDGHGDGVSEGPSTSPDQLPEITPLNNFGGDAGKSAPEAAEKQSRPTEPTVVPAPGSERKPKIAPPGDS